MVAAFRIEVQGTTISIISRPGGNFISLTDMVRNFDGAGALIEQWLKISSRNSSASKTTKTTASN